MRIEPQAGAGALVSGVDLSRPLDDGDRQDILGALGDYGVVFVHDQELTPDQHVRLAEQFGEINVNRFFTPVAGHPQIAEVAKLPDQQLNIGGGWHTDHSYDQIPAMGSMLYARIVPNRGGDTLFANMYAAFDALSDGMKEMLCGLCAVHSSRHVFGRRTDREAEGQNLFHNPELATQDAVHPVIIRHPISGRSALYVNPGFTVRFDDWSVADSEPLLTYLYRHAARPEFSHRFRWRPGSLAFWDNRATWHYALNDYAGEHRLMHRITLEGGPLAGATS